MKTRRILMGALALAMLIAIVVACKKEKDEVIVLQEPEEIVKKPLAAFNKMDGSMTYFLTEEIIQETLEHMTFSKDSARFVVESFEIISMDSIDNVDGNGNVWIRFSIIDTDSEKSYTAYLNSEFLEIVSFGNSVVYYIAEDVENGTFSFTNFMNDGAYTITIANHKMIGVEAIPDSLLYYAPRPKKTVTCESQGCIGNGCGLYYDAYGNPDGCSDCGVPPSENVYCRKTITGGSGGDATDWIGIAITVLFGVLSILSI